jgi:ferric-dicitrate binding protein FerR (iron transport regulator)
MSEPDPISEELQDLVDAYLDGTLDEAGHRDLEARLHADAAAMRYFVRYCRLHTDMALEARGRRAGQRALGAIATPTDNTSASPAAPSGERFIRRSLGWAMATTILLVLTAVWLLSRNEGGPGQSLAIAWLVNAQDCKWAGGAEPAGELHAGKSVRIERGLAELRFRSGASLVLEGPADLELLSASSARLRQGKLATRIPESAIGFTILSPQGKVIDLGTEFGVAVGENGTTEVVVFEGKVEAHPVAPAGQPLSLTKDEAARLGPTGVTRPAEVRPFVRAIVPPPLLVPRTLALDFRRIVDGPIRDAAGRGTGLTHRLPGTGFGLPQNDPNLTLDVAQGRLELLTTNSDINRQFKLDQGEYLGIRLAELGFTGDEDFEVTATIPSIPALQRVGQFGLYAGVRSDKNIRGGLISQKEGEYTQFLVHNNGGRDADLYRVGLLSTGDDLQLTLRRTAGKYALTINNLTAGGDSTLSIRPADFLAGTHELYVGLFGANTQSEVRRTLVVKEFKVTVWTRSP